jgi:tetratricopeptide (TPR) repeat protein
MEMAQNFRELFEKGYLARRERRPADARAIFLDGVRKASEEGDRPSLAEAFCGLAQAERDIENLEAARHHYANAVVLYRQIGPSDKLAYAIRHEAEVLRQMGQATAAEPLYIEAEGIYRDLGGDASLDLANTLRGLALTREETATVAESRPLWLEARDLYAQCGVDAGVRECDRRLSVQAPVSTDS